MKIVRVLRGAVVAGAALALGITVAPAAASATNGSGSPAKTRSLAALLTADKSGFDHRSYDFDILTKAVLTVLDAKPSSPVSVLADGSVALTAFVPTDAAFQRLAQEVAGNRHRPSEKAAFTTIAGLGVDTVEAVLLYHVVPGATIDRTAALAADGAALTTAAGGTVTVDVLSRWHGGGRIRLIDADTSDRDPRVVLFNLNKGNKQIAHGIDRVLRPVDLP